jgi:hypothetical protein
MQLRANDQGTTVVFSLSLRWKISVMLISSYLVIELGWILNDLFSMCFNKALPTTFKMDSKFINIRVTILSIILRLNWYHLNCDDY